MRLQVPLSQLQGKPTPMTFTYDGEQVTALLASPWTTDDVAVALAVQQAEDAACPGCGGDLAKTTDPDHQFDWQAATVRCHNCVARHDEAADDDRPGLLVRSWFEVDERIAR